MLTIALITVAQNVAVSGKVINSSGVGLPGINIQEKGSRKGTVTTPDGSFSITVPSSATLIVSGVGFTTQEVSVAGKSSFEITLTESAVELNSVVVTALGISKQSRRVGYAVSTVAGDQLNKARETNVALSLTGQVAGLNVRGTNGGPGGSARILLRGMSSQSAGSPLFVVNGIPIDNTQRGSAGEWGGADNGDGIGNLSPDDIESISVLKGQSASALYGARASNGVIMITTKSAKKGTLSVEYNMNLLADKPIDFTDFQYVYGQGQNGAKPGSTSEAQATARMSWGAKLDGSSVIQFDGNSYPYSAVKNNLTSFYRTGSSFTNTVSVSKGTENGSFRLSASNLDNASILRNSGLDRKNFNLNIDQKITDKLSVSVYANYIIEKGKNRPNLSDGPLNANNGLFLATNINQKILAPGYDLTTGAETVFSDDIYVTNPWFVVNQFVNNVNRKRFISAVTAKYQLTSWLYAQGRIGYDNLNDSYFSVTPWGTAYSNNQRGGLNNQSTVQTNELNLDAILGASKKIGTDFSIDAIVGGNQRKNQSESIGINGGPFIVPYQYSYNNVVNFGRSYGFSKKQVNSGFYNIDFGYRNFLILSTSGRYDVYSTVANSAIPKKDWGIFTPSVSAAIIYSDLLKMPALNYGKLRLSYAQTSGEPTDPYQTAITYGIGNTFNGVSTGTFGSGLPNTLLKPFTTTEYEVGTEIKLFNSRLGFDVSYYTKKTKDEILGGQLSPATGYTSGYVATGSTKNSGLELMVTGTPVKEKNFRWNISFNLTTLKTEVLATDANNNSLQKGTYRPLNANTAFIRGLAPQIRAYDYAYDAKGNIIVDNAGLPVRGELKASGNVLPTLYGGLNNSLEYKNFNLSFLIDYNYGNYILSATKYYALRRGLDKATLVGRETGITNGVTAGGAVNTVTASAQDYYRALAQNVSKVNVLNGDFIKLRQVTIGYSIPEKSFAKLPLIRSIQISLVGRNLLVLMKKSDNIDPEAGFSSQVSYAGIEGTSLPSARTFGFNLNFKFK
jgi:TonB-linked SusC/RagA family outer membrane protein